MMDWIVEFQFSINKHLMEEPIVYIGIIVLCIIVAYIVYAIINKIIAFVHRQLLTWCIFKYSIAVGKSVGLFMSGVDKAVYGTEGFKHEYVYVRDTVDNNIYPVDKNFSMVWFSRNLAQSMYDDKMESVASRLISDVGQYLSDFGIIRMLYEYRQQRKGLYKAIGWLIMSTMIDDGSVVIDNGTEVKINNGAYTLKADCEENLPRTLKRVTEEDWLQASGAKASGSTDDDPH